MGKYKITYQGKEIEIERLPNGKFKIPPLGQFTKQGLGSTWLDDCRIPHDEPIKEMKAQGLDTGNQTFGQGGRYEPTTELKQSGRFPANLLVSDDVLNDGREHKSGSGNKSPRQHFGNTIFRGGLGQSNSLSSGGDTGSFSRFFDLDKWAHKTFPFLIVPKASKSEKNKGCEDLPASGYKGVYADDKWSQEHMGNTPKVERMGSKNNHPTVKPLKLMSYLITLGSRGGDIILDPFLGSGTTALASKLLGRKCIGIEIEEKYCEIAANRCRQTEMMWDYEL